MLLPFLDNSNASLYIDVAESQPLEHSDTEVSKVAIKVANFDWSVIMIITTLFLCILYVCGFALLCLKAISSLGENTNMARDALIVSDISDGRDLELNFGNIHNQIIGNQDRRSSDGTFILHWQEDSNIL